MESCADTEKLREIFLKYASVKDEDEPFMSSNDFVQKFLGICNEHKFNKKTVRLLAGIASKREDGRVSFEEFVAFEKRLCSRDALYKTAFQLFDQNGHGAISYDDFVGITKHLESYKKMPFNFQSKFIDTYFGKKKDRTISYMEFCRFLQDFQEEYAMDAYSSKDPKGLGFIGAEDFQFIMLNVQKHLLSKYVMENLLVVTDGNEVTYPCYMAFRNLLQNIDLVQQIYLNATKNQLKVPLAHDKFSCVAQTMSRLTPLEISMLYKLTTSQRKSGQIVFKDISKLNPIKSPVKRGKNATRERTPILEVFENLYRFILASLSGAIGTFCVYPVDLLKTRIQNQRPDRKTGEYPYKGYIDCFRKVCRKEGFTRLYRGSLPIMLGASPEKASKLAVFDFFRDKIIDEDDYIPLWGEIFAGTMSGIGQDIFACPLEFIKIQLQIAGERKGGHKLRALHVVKKAGFFGLYTGMSACLLRDIPFNWFYFPVYSRAKAHFADENGYNNASSLLLSGFVAGVPASGLVTPADVIKTRLQTQFVSGRIRYKNVIDAFQKIMAEEGPRALFKGSLARVFRISPQFGITLFSYEMFQRFFYIDFGGRRPTGSYVKATDSSKGNPDHIGGYKFALPTLKGIETKFGLLLPSYAVSRWGS